MSRLHGRGTEEDPREHRQEAKYVVNKLKYEGAPAATNVVHGPAITQTQFIGPSGQTIPGYARPKSAGTLRRFQQAASGPTAQGPTNYYPTQQVSEPRYQGQLQLDPLDQSTTDASRKPHMLYVPAGMQVHHGRTEISKSSPALKPAPASSLLHNNTNNVSLPNQHQQFQGTSASEAALKVVSPVDVATAVAIMSNTQQVNSNNNSVPKIKDIKPPPLVSTAPAAAAAALPSSSSPTVSDTKKIVNVTRPQSAAARIRSDITQSKLMEQHAHDARVEGPGPSTVDVEGERLRQEQLLLAREDDDDMDGYRPNIINNNNKQDRILSDKALLDSRSHPEISIATLSQSLNGPGGNVVGLLAGGASASGCDVRQEDSLLEDITCDNIGLSTLPNQFCTIRDALELKRLLLLSNESRGGMVPSSTAVMDMYMVGRVVGVGSYGKVRAAWHRLTAAKVAIKTYDKVKLKDPSHWKRVNSEIQIMEQVSHPRIARLYEAVETPKRMHLIMECLEGADLCSYVKQRRRLAEDESRAIFVQLVQAIDYLHSHGVAHRDVKLENVLFVHNTNSNSSSNSANCSDVKLIDFGFATVCQPDKKLKVFCGTPSYMAPEIVRRTEYEGRPVDMWSLGILLYALLCGCFPFRAKSYPDLYRRIARGTFSMPDELSFQVKDLLAQLLHVDPERRMQASAVLRHPWLQPCVATAPDMARLRLETKTLISDRASDDIDEETLLELNTFGLPRDDLIRLVMAKVHSSMTTVYYLLLDIVDRRRRASSKPRQLIAPPAYTAPTKRAHSAGATRPSAAGAGGGAANAPAFMPNHMAAAANQPAQHSQQQQQLAQQHLQSVLQQPQPSNQQFLYSAAGNTNTITPGGMNRIVASKNTSRPLSANAGRK